MDVLRENRYFSLGENGRAATIIELQLARQCLETFY